MSSEKKKKKKKKKNTKKLKQECAFLSFVANNPNVQQTKRFLSELVTKSQLLALRELAVNDLAKTLPHWYGSKKGKSGYNKTLKLRILRLARGVLKRRNLHHLYPYLRIVCHNALNHHGLCN